MKKLSIYSRQAKITLKMVFCCLAISFALSLVVTLFNYNVKQKERQEKIKNDSAFAYNLIVDSIEILNNPSNIVVDSGYIDNDYNCGLFFLTLTTDNEIAESKFYMIYKTNDNTVKVDTERDVENILGETGMLNFVNNAKNTSSLDFNLINQMLRERLQAN